MKGERLRQAYRIIAAIVLFAGIPIFVLGAGFAGGWGGALSSFRMGLAAASPLNWFFLLPVLLLPIYWWFGRRSACAPTNWLWRAIIGGACLFGLVMLFGSFRDTPVAEWPSACHRGAFKLDDGRVMGVSPSPVAALNVRLSDGNRAITWTGDHLSFSGSSCYSPENVLNDFAFEAVSCPSAALMVDAHDAGLQIARRVPLMETPADFKSGGINFRARLFTPPGNEPIPLVILPASRSGSSNLDFGDEQYILAGLGAAVFVYDKPEGWPYGRAEIGSDEEAIRHAAAAFARVTSLAGTRFSKVGFYGGRDALLAASRTEADFVAADLNEADATLLMKIRAPMLLFTPGGDADIPTQNIVKLVQRLQNDGRQASIAVFPNADKHMTRLAHRGGVSCRAGEPKSYFPILAEWIVEGAIQPPPDARIYSP